MAIAATDDSADVETDGDPNCPHETWKVTGVTPDDLLYGCTACPREVWGC